MDWQTITIKKHREFMKADFITLGALVSDQQQRPSLQSQRAALG